MDPKRVEQLADRIRQTTRPRVDLGRVKQHLDAACAKLESLQATRQRLKAELANCIDERDDALSQVKRLQNRHADRTVTSGDLQQALIEKLQTERTFLLQALEGLVTDLKPGSNHAFTTVADKAQSYLTALHGLNTEN